MNRSPGPRFVQPAWCAARPRAAERVRRVSEPVPSTRGWLALLGWIALIGVVWLGILPRVAQHPGVRDRRQHLDAKQVDPSAMFYTELAGIGRLLDELDDRNRSDLYFY